MKIDLTKDEIEELVFALEFAEHQTASNTTELKTKLNAAIMDESDNTLSLQPLVDSDFLDLPPYPFQFVSNEVLLAYRASVEQDAAIYTTEFTPILPGTMTGVVEFDDVSYLFVVGSNGFFNLYDEFSGTLNLNTGELYLNWKNTGNTTEPKVTVSYEYNME